MSTRTVIESIRSNQHLVTIEATASAFQAACLMDNARTGSIVVVDGSGSMLGILTERDLMCKVTSKALKPEATAVSEIMTGHPRHVSPNTSVTEAVLIMKAGGYRHLPILSKNKLVGIFSIRDATPSETIEADRQVAHLERVFDSVGY